MGAKRPTKAQVRREMVAHLRREVALWQERVPECERAIAEAQARLEYARQEVETLQAVLARWEGLASPLLPAAADTSACRAIEQAEGAS